MSNGGSAPTPRHILMVCKCRRFSSSTCATIHNTLGRSPGVTSYSKSHTTRRVKLLTGLPRADQAEQTGMVCRLDHAVFKRDLNQFAERLLGPIGLREGVIVPREFDLIRVDTLITPACDHRPFFLGHMTTLQTRLVVGVVEIERRQRKNLS